MLAALVCISLSISDRSDGPPDSREQVCLPKIQVIVVTKLMEAGMNGSSLKFAKCNRFPSSFYELVQQLTRVDRKGNAEPGSNTCEIHVDFNSYISLFLRIIKIDCKKEEGKIQITQLH